jgi:tetratricopeptide (TPR) repeat protein
MSNSADIRGFLQQAASAGESGDFATAERCCRQALALDPGNNDALGLMGMVCWHGGDIEGAMAALERAHELRPRGLAALYAMAQAHLEGDNHERAIECYRRALAIAPQAVEIHDALNEILWEHGMREDYLGDREHIGKILQPKEGHLVLFPSYMFHGTVPFPSNEIRTTIAFDVMPV